RHDLPRSWPWQHDDPRLLGEIEALPALSSYNVPLPLFARDASQPTQERNRGFLRLPGMWFGQPSSAETGGRALHNMWYTATCGRQLTAGKPRDHMRVRRVRPAVCCL